MATPAEARCRFLYVLNIAVTGGLALHFLACPATAAATHFGDTRADLGGGGLMAAGGGPAPTLGYRMLGAWWAAVAALSLLGLLRDPFKFSPVFLMQIAYKVVYLPVAIAPLVAAGRWSAFPALPTAVFAGYLAPLFYCTPWTYLFGGGRKAQAQAGFPAGAADGATKAE